LQKEEDVREQIEPDTNRS